MWLLPAMSHITTIALSGCSTQELEVLYNLAAAQAAGFLTNVKHVILAKDVLEGNVQLAHALAACPQLQVSSARLLNPAAVEAARAAVCGLLPGNDPAARALFERYLS